MNYRFNSIGFMLYLLGTFAGFSQSCDFLIAGIITDISTQKGLPFAEVYLQETKQGTVTDEDGKYLLPKVCKGKYHLVVRHLSCDAKTLLVDVTKNIRLNIDLEHAQSILGHVIVKSNKAETLQEQLTVNKKKIEDNLSENLGDLTEKFTGVSSFKNGSGVSKPIIHGLYGNRVAILNNGIPLAGQQWGIDHAPEIDAQSAQKISVIKGVAAIKYPAAQLGGVVLVESSEIDKDPHLHGRANAFVETNGAATGTSLQLQQYKGKIGWKLTGTTKQSGDRKTPDYFLRNTGSEQRNLSLQLASDITKKWKTNLNLSYFYTNIGILRGAQGSTDGDLVRNSRKSRPNFTKDIIGFGIEAPRQDVDHYFGKWKLGYEPNKNTSFTGIISGQENIRKEFDAGRGNLSNVALLNLNQKSYQAEGIWNQKWSDWRTEFGLQRVYIDNTNAPASELRIRRLIPDYIRTKLGSYAIIKSPKSNSFVGEVGFRISRDQQNVVTNRPLEEVMRYNNSFMNISGALGLRYKSSNTNYAFNIGYVDRSPDLVERFIDGVHLTEATIVKGNPNLKNEIATKLTASIDTFINGIFTINLLGYYQFFQDYIYQEPVFEGRIGLGAVLPVNEYKQTEEVVFTGLDLTLGYEISDNWSTNLKGSYLYAQDISNEQPVIFAPANNIAMGTAYNFSKALSILGKKWQNLSLRLNQRYEFEQKRFPFLKLFPDYPSPPPGFYVVDANASAEIPLGETRLRVVLKGENVLNNVYRNYLNRLRFYADEEGFNVNLTAILTF